MTNFDSRTSSYRYVPVDGFNPNSAVGWTAFANVTQCLYDKADEIFTLTGTAPVGGTAPVLKIYILGPAAFRVRFNPQGDYSMDGSFAVVNKNLGAANANVLQNDETKLSVDLGTVRLDVLFQPFTVQVFWKNRLISTDTAQGLIYVATGGEAVANFKAYPANANYFGAGEKGGEDLRLNEGALTFFNYDNYKYCGQNTDDALPPNGDGFLRDIPSSSQPGPLNWSEPLYNSIPFFIEDNPNPVDGDGQSTGVPYAYGILLDNESETYMNFGASSSFNDNMYGKYFFGALYGEIDYYFMAGDTTQDVLKQYSTGGGKEASLGFTFTGSPVVSKTYGNLAFTARNLQFTQLAQQQSIWVVQSNTHFVFSAENKQFAAVDQIFYFGMNGRGYFAQGSQAQDVSLGGSSKLGQTPVDMVSVHLTTPASAATVLAALFNTNVHLSEVMPAAAMQVNYQVNESGNNYSTIGPTNSPFTIDVPYPSGQPSSEAKVHPVYSGTSGNEYSGTVDLSELGGPPITGEFRLGYQGGHDYWLTRVSYALGPTGIPLIAVPPVMNLYRVQGGLGHNFPISAFEDTGSLSAATPVADNSYLVMAGMRVGMPDQFTYTLDGDLTIKAGGQNAGARLDFHSWLLKPPDNSNGDFQGFLQYAGSNFDGRLWGHLNFLGGIASVDMGNSASNAAVDIHFGPSGPWHIDAGKQQGPRIDGHLLVTDANMYVMLSDTGLAIGGGESINLNVGDNSVASAYINGSVDIGLAVTPQPHISGDFSANVDAGVCVDDVCVSAGVSAQIHAEALPLDMNASASIGLPWPLGSISFSVHL